MFKKKLIAYFNILLIPMFIVSALLNLSYGIKVRGYIQINWLIVILVAIVFDAFIAWMQTRKAKEKEI
jgi:hypothetical protein